MAPTRFGQALRALGWGLLALLGLALALVLAWLPFNLGDADPQPWPERLRSEVGGGSPGLDLSGLQQPVRGGTLSLGDCRENTGAAASAPPDATSTRSAVQACRDRWAERLPQLAALRAAHPALGAACNAVVAQLPARWLEPLPARVSNHNLHAGGFLPIGRCTAWWLSEALDASLAGQRAAALTALRKAERWNRARFEGSRTLMEHQLAAGVWRQRLQVLTWIGEDHPDWRAELAPQAALSGASTLAAVRRWLPTEASVVRHTVEDLATSLQEGRTPAPPELPAEARPPDPSLYERALVRLHAPQYSQQRVAQQFLQALEAAAGDDPASFAARLPTLFQPAGADAFGRLLGWDIRWQHTVPNLMLDVAWSVWHHHLQNSVTLHAQASATHRWLQNPDPQVPAPAVLNP